MGKRSAIIAGCLLIFLAGGVMGAENRIPKAGIGFMAGISGIPGSLLDFFLYEHPEIRGNLYALEFRSYGDKGPKSVFSGLYCLEYNRISGQGYWRIEQSDRRLLGSGDVVQWNLTATILLNIFPTSVIHLYLGGGIGIGRMKVQAEGVYVDEVGTTISQTYQLDKIIPVGHLPVGLIVNVGNHLELRAEAGFKNGFYGAASVVFNY